MSQVGKLLTLLLKYRCDKMKDIKIFLSLFIIVLLAGTASASTPFNYYLGTAPITSQTGGNVTCVEVVNDSDSPNPAAKTWNMTFDGTGMQWAGVEQTFTSMTVLKGDVLTVSGDYKVPASFTGTNFACRLVNRTGWITISNNETITFIKDNVWHHYSVNLIATENKTAPTIIDAAASGIGKQTLTGSIYFNNISITKNAPSHITFTTAGSNEFHPRINVTGSPTISWVFGDGSTSSSTAPDINYGTYATREATLTVTPWENLTQINLGYTGDDEGETPNVTILNLTNQHVSRVDGLENVAPYLEYWASSYNPITQINFSEFTQLKNIEMYHCTDLTNLTLKNNTNLTRICIENGHLSTLDLSETPAIQDLRVSRQSNTAGDTFSITWGNFIYPDLWHLCINNDNIVTPIPFENLTYLNEIWLWDSNYSWNVHLNSTNLKDVSIYNNSITELNLSGCCSAGSDVYVGGYNNNLTRVIFTKNDTGLVHLDVHNNRLKISAVDEILSVADSMNITGTGKVFDLTYNAVPSSEGLAHANNLTG